MVEEQILDDRGAAQDQAVDGKVTERLPERPERLQPLDEYRQVACNRGEVGRRHGEVPVGEILGGAARPRAGQLDSRYQRMRRNRRDREIHDVPHALLIADTRTCVVRHAGPFTWRSLSSRRRSANGSAIVLSPSVASRSQTK